MVTQQNFLGVIKVLTSNIYLSNMIFPLTCIKLQLILIYRHMYYQWIKIEGSPGNKRFDSIKDFSIRSFWYHSKTDQEEPLGFVQISLLMTHLDI